MSDQGFSQLKQAKSELESISGWARVAVAVRCAQRTLPVLTLSDGKRGLPAPFQDAVREAVESARKAALSAHPSSDDTAERCFSVSRPLSRQATQAQSDSGGKYTEAVFHLHCCAFTAVAAGCAAQAAAASGMNVDPCQRALSSTYDALSHISSVAADSLGGAALDDISWLKGQHSSPGKVQIEFFNRHLWPLGEPAGWADQIAKRGGSASAAALRRSWWMFWR